MKPIVWCFGLLICSSVASGRAAPLMSTPLQTMKVSVVNADQKPIQPVHNALVSLTHIDGSRLVTEGSVEGTDAQGEAFLRVTQDVAARGDLCLKIDHASNLVIYSPADGQLQAFKPEVTIQLLPKGSPALLDPTQIEAMLYRLSLENKQLKQELKAAAETDDLTAAMNQWASAHGFLPADVDKKVQSWATDIQHQAHPSDRQKALAELAFKHYGAAAQLLNKVAADDNKSLDEDDKLQMQTSSIFVTIWQRRPSSKPLIAPRRS